MTSSASSTPVVSNMSTVALPPNGKASNASGGQLIVAVLSAYDLNSRDPPSYVSVTIDGTDLVAKSGPPSQRHKDRNSFKFSPNQRNTADSASPPHELTLSAPLPLLYQTQAVVSVVYTHKPAANLVATYTLNQLKIGESTWIVLNLEPQDANNVNVSTNIETESNNMSVPPTIRLQMTLNGPYRAEIAALVSVMQTWFDAIDGAERSLQRWYQALPKLPIDAKYALVPAAPFLGTLVVCMPIFIGLGVLFLPMVLPLVVAACTAGAVGVGTGTVVYGSTAQGRQQVGAALAPLAHTILSTPSGQSLVYQTGPRPSPVNVLRLLLPHGMWGRLCVSLVLDLVGSSSYLLPIVGEAFDIVWAPIQTLFIMALYDDIAPHLKYVSFIEEISPFTDLVPSAILGWLAQFGLPMVFGPGKPLDVTSEGQLLVSGSTIPLPTKVLSPSSWSSAGAGTSSPRRATPGV